MTSRTYKDEIYIGVIAFILALAFFVKCGDKQIPQEPSVVYDTIVKVKHDTVLKTVKLYKTIPGKVIPLPSKNCDSLKQQYVCLAEECGATNIYKDTISLGENGTIAITDSVEFNKLKKRSVIKNLKFVTIEKTITKEAPITRDLFFGPNVIGNRNTFQLFNASLLYKDRKNVLYEGIIGVSIDGTLSYGAGIHWKIN